MLRTVAALTLGALALSAWAAVPGIPPEGPVTAEHIDEAIQSVNARTDLDEETKGQVLEQLRDAEAQIRNRQAAEAAAAEFATAIETAPAETEKLLEALRQDLPSVTLDDLSVDGDEPLALLEQSLTQASADLATVNTRLAELETAIAAAGSRPTEARARISELRTATAELEASLASEPPPDEPTILSDARRLATEQRLLAFRAQLTRLDNELRSQTVRLALRRAERDMADREQTLQERRVDLLTNLVNSKRLTSAEEAQVAAAAVEQRFADSHPVVRKLAQGNAELTRELPSIARSIEETTASLANAESTARNIERSLARSRQRLQIAGVSQAMARLLDEERRTLPRVAQYRDQLRQRRETLSMIGLAQVGIEEERRELTPITNAVDELLREVEVQISDADDLARIRAELRELLINKRDLLNQASASYSSYLAALGDLDIAQRKVLQTAEEYRDFLGRNLLWLPSSPPIGLQTFSKAGEALAWSLSPSSWSETAIAVTQSLEDRPIYTLAAALLIAGLLFARKPLTARSVRLNQQVGRLSTDSIGVTLKSLGITALNAMPVPLTLWFIGFSMMYGPDQTQFVQAVSAALLTVAPFLYNTSVFRGLCKPNGVAQVHFGWPAENLAILRRQFYLLIVIGAPLAFIAVMLFRSGIPTHQDSAGRLAFVALLVVFALVLHPIEHPNHGVAAAFYNREPNTWMSRLRWIWYALAVGSPIGLAALTLVGYTYTAGVLTGEVVDTIWLVLAIVIVNLVVLRWLALSRRQIEWHAALAKRESRKPESPGEDAPTTELGAEGAAPTIPVEPLDLDAVDQQMRRLLQAVLAVVAAVGIWGIWAETLPALNVLDEISLWSKTAIVDGVDTIEAVTLADVTLAALILIATLVGSRNLPGLTEIAILKHLELQPGSRYAINTLLRYIVITIGIVAVLNIVGLPWSRVQWLVAALGVGLGFGLQEIVANFVSGLIILFERPVRVGDTVTVGNLTGAVSRVRIRATTITDWDRKEIIVPNKAFITEQVVNWTLSDPITRVVIDLGIAYASDVKLAHRVIEDTLKANPLILDEPEPRAYFMGFGDSSLQFRLYMYSRELGDRFPIMHSVHNDILEALRRNNIEIPFPQRDLHIRSTVERAERSD